MVKICCCTGHRPKGFPFQYGVDKKEHKKYLEALLQKIEFAINEHHITHFISGMAVGVDLDFAEFVLRLRDKKHCAISLECALPCPNQTAKWSRKEIKRYNKILRRADVVNTISDDYSRECMLKRNRYIVDKSDLVIAVFNGIERGGTWYTINYAKRKNKTIELIELCDFLRN